LLAYNARGRVLHLDPGDTPTPGRLTGDPSPTGEAPRLLAARSDEELLFLHTSGRVSTRTLEQVAASSGDTWAWEALPLPDEPHAGEQLACVMPLAELPLADFFLQTSRRGYLKKTMASMAQGILSNHYLGRGATQKADQPFDVTLCRKGERLVMASHAGRIVCIEIDDLSYAPEERIRLDATDHIVAAFVLHAGESLFAVSNTGKVIHRPGGELEPAKSGLARGLALLSPTRLEQGIRLVGAVAVRDADRVLVLAADGSLSLHGVADLSGAGAVSAEGGLVAFAPVPAPEGGKVG
jgi:DNA gyrase/topoisomerase IV subunit A